MRILAIALIAVSAWAAGPEPADKSKWSAEGREYMVAADHPLASEAGAGILAQGGNAVDAAVATSFALAVTRPYSTGLGGGGFMVIKLRGKKPLVYDYRETAPAAAVPEAYLDKGKVIPGKTFHGHWAVGVPGQVRGITTILKRHGSMTLAEVLEPAIELAEKGYPVDKSTLKGMRYLAGQVKKHPNRYEEIARIYLADGKPYPLGWTLKQPDLAKTLRLLAKEGPELFYSGEIGRKIVADMERWGGPLTMKDLEGYSVRERAPLTGRFRDYEVLAMPPPSSGGACVLQVLNIMDGYGKLTESAYYYALAESMKHAFADRAQYLGDADAHPDVVPDVERMISREHARRVRASIGKKTREPKRYGMRALKDDSGTSHFNVLDKDGNAVAATETVNYVFGSLVVPPGTGIVLNNELDDFSVRTDVPNEFGLLMSERNVIRPGARPLSSMSPTMLVKNDRVVLAAGGSGGPMIISGTMQTIFQIIDFGKKPAEAVAAGRIHHQWSPNKVEAEKSVPWIIRRRLAKAGHKVRGYRLYAGAVQVVYAEDGVLYGASDPRKGGRPAGR